VSTTRARAGRGISIDGVWAALAVLLPVAATLLVRSQALDLAYQIRAGSTMLDTGSLLRSDIFTYTVPGRPWLNQQWGVQLVLAGVYRGVGWPGLNAMRGAVVALTTLFVYRACRAQGADPRTSSGLTLAGWLVSLPVLAQLRPQLFGAALFALSLWIVSARSERPRVVWWLPAVVLVWANVHGSFVLVFPLIGLTILDAAGDRPAMRRLAAVLVTCAFATLANPYGGAVWTYVVNVTTDPVVRELIGEWMVPSVAGPIGALFWVSVLGVLALVVARRRWFGWTALVGLAGFAILGAIAARGVVWWGLGAPVILAAVLARRRTSVASPVRAPSAAGVVVVGCLAIVTVLAWASARGTDPASGGPRMLTFAPEHLSAAVRDAVPPGSHVFVSQLPASWFELTAPDLPVAVDSRIELFPERVWEDYLTVSAGTGDWEAILDRDDVEALLLDPDQASGILTVLADHAGWSRILETADGAVYVRR
jgi:hypothetical protein